MSNGFFRHRRIRLLLELSCRFILLSHGIILSLRRVACVFLNGDGLGLQQVMTSPGRRPSRDCLVISCRARGLWRSGRAVCSVRQCRYRLRPL
jgi:hypothetical protein